MNIFKMSLLMACALVGAASAVAQTATAVIVQRADAFLSSLDDKQRQTVMFAFNDAQQRARWSNFPTRVVRRAGISLRDMNAKQRDAAMALLAATLSPRGLEKVQQIMDGDEANKALERNNPLFGGDFYYFSILGTPSATAPWMLQFGGHHLALNITISGDRGVITPTLTGAQPALYTKDGKTVRPLGAESDKGFALVAALDDAQRQRAILKYRVADLVLGPGHDGQTIQPEGLPVSAMNPQQRALLLDLIAEWSGIVNDSYASPAARRD